MALVVKNPSASAEDKRDLFDPWVGKIPWRRKWQLTPVFLLGEFYGERDRLQSTGLQREIQGRFKFYNNMYEQWAYKVF